MEKSERSKTIAIVGLGYVGLPLAAAFAKKRNVIGFDVDERKIAKLKEGDDPTKTLTKEELTEVKILYTSDAEAIKKAGIVIVCVPTPITKELLPDTSYLEKASETVGKHLGDNAIVVFESTVYPGVTEEICKPILEKISGKHCGADFFLGYSPERINPGDHEHTLSKIVKVVAGSDKEITEELAQVYSEIITAGVHKASSIKVAEAAKVIENTQRDLNIALMNELALIFEKMDIPTYEVLEAAGTKWNFHKYYPGLVGGHCIGVDPYYLTFKAKQLGYDSKVILAGRSINDAMHKEVKRRVAEVLVKQGTDLKHANIAVLGVTFKENVNDMRNSRMVELCHELQEAGVNVLAVDPLIDEEEMKKYDLQKTALEHLQDLDAVIYAVPHTKFKEVTEEFLKNKMKKQGVVFDVRNKLKKAEVEKHGLVYLSW